MGAMALLGCREGDLGEHDIDVTYAVSDSAGVEVIRYPGGDLPLEMRRVLRLGVVDGDPLYQFHRIRTLSITEDGELWLVDGHPSVRGYDRRGVHLGSVGGAGSGPGEAQEYGSAWAGGAQVLAVGNPGGFQLFDREGSLRWTGANRLPDGGLVTPLGRTADRWVLRVDRTPATGDRLFRMSSELHVLDSLGALVEPVLTFPGELRTSQGGRGPYLRGNPHIALDPRGRLVVSDSAEYRLEFFDLNGTLIRIVERAVSPRPVDTAMLTHVREGTERAVLRGPFGDRDASRPLSPDERSNVEDLWDDAASQAAVPHVPVVGALLIGHGGTMWVRRADLDPRPGLRAVAHAFGYVRWGWHAEWVHDQFFDVYSGTHDFLGTVRVPADFWPMAVYRDLVYGVAYDPLGVEFVDVYRLVDTD
jgi:hypothetical protein